MHPNKDGNSLFFASQSNELKWYAISVHPNQEKNVSAHLCVRNVEHYLPLYRSVRQWKDRRVVRESPLFPGYVLVKQPVGSWSIVLSIPRVITVIGCGKVPSEIPEVEVAFIKQATHSAVVEPHSYLREGDRVLVKSGPLAGLSGIIVRRQNTTRVVVNIEPLSRSFAVEVHESCLESIEM